MKRGIPVKLVKSDLTNIRPSSKSYLTILPFGACNYVNSDDCVVRQKTFAK